MHSKLFSRFDPKHEDNKEFVQALSEVLSLAARSKSGLDD
jgi:hypothetical protein